MKYSSNKKPLYLSPNLTIFILN